MDEDYALKGDEPGFIIDSRGQIVYDEIAYLTYWQGIEDERDPKP